LKDLLYTSSDDEKVVPHAVGFEKLLYMSNCANSKIMAEKPRVPKEPGHDEK
jgi:hypothetical protein